MEPEWGGLSPFGKEVVTECNRLGIMLDSSHASDETFYDILKYSSTPVIASHSSCRALCSHPRNMSDIMLRDLASAGGVVQINFYPKFIDNDFADEKFLRLSEEGEKWQELYRSDLYNEVYRDNYFAGIEHVGLGSDFDGIEIAPEGLRDISMYGNIRAELQERGYREQEIRGILGGNLLRVMHEVLSKAQS